MSAKDPRTHSRPTDGASYIIRHLALIYHLLLRSTTYIWQVSIWSRESPERTPQSQLRVYLVPSKPFSVRNIWIWFIPLGSLPVCYLVGQCHRAGQDIASYHSLRSRDTVTTPNPGPPRMVGRSNLFFFSRGWFDGSGGIGRPSRKNIPRHGYQDS